MTATSSDLMVDNLKLRVQRQGTDGPVVLFLHGAGGLAGFPPFLQQIAKGRRLIAPDHPGFGQSQDADLIRDVPDMAMFYLDLIEQLDLTDVHVVGHSLGGWIAAEMAVRNSSRLKSLSLISPAGVRLKGHPMGDIFIWSPEEEVRNLFCDQSIAERQLAQELSSEQIDVMLRNRYTFTKLAWEPRGFNPALQKWLHRVKVPTQVIWGKQDKVLPPALAAHWGRLIPHARVTTIESCGHLPLIEKPEETAQLVNAHLNEVA
ncbi:Pimeloyl-ACP methyl ester carboxylesterase [Variovorax sp. HW608]|uniref:alpha/beta fold hydrolase n=1 Tax=Variovorax sp. HW608 TaxID=1034889 RepID=UPI00081F8F2F|nr:alpha/beta fold hydrolase [Variovorax sp. HW608]SCK15012.1 Pimeloyl-ACP methyl ester carboxylesterase [Variovorax sp. HW608]